jgi:hypothetical protein
VGGDQGPHGAPQAGRGGAQEDRSRRRPRRGNRSVKSIKETPFFRSVERCDVWKKGLFVCD